MAALACTADEHAGSCLFVVLVPSWCAADACTRTCSGRSCCDAAAAKWASTSTSGVFMRTCSGRAGCDAVAAKWASTSTSGVFMRTCGGRAGCDAPYKLLQMQRACGCLFCGVVLVMCAAGVVRGPAAAGRSVRMRGSLQQLLVLQLCLWRVQCLLPVLYSWCVYRSCSSRACCA
jgi:hypothetical protein